MNYCKDCAHHIASPATNSNPGTYSKCRRKGGTEHHDLVTGDKTMIYPFCDMERADESACGRDGKHFKAAQ